MTGCSEAEKAVITHGASRPLQAPTPSARQMKASVLLPPKRTAHRNAEDPNLANIGRVAEVDILDAYLVGARLDDFDRNGIGVLVKSQQPAIGEIAESN